MVEIAYDHEPNELENFVGDMLCKVESREIETLVVVAFTKGGDVSTGYVNASIADRMVAASWIQMDTTDKVFQSGYVLEPRYDDIEEEDEDDA